MAKSISEQILDVAVKNRKKIHFEDGKLKVFKEVEKRLKFDRQYLLDFLRKNNIHSLEDLVRVRKINVDPSFSHYRKEFKKWTVALDAAYGTTLSVKGSDNEEHIIKLMLQFEVFSILGWKRCVTKYPDIFPSYHRVVRKFGSFSLAVFAAKQHSSLYMIDAFIKLKEKLGRLPTFEECKLNNVDLTKLKRIFKRKGALATYIDNLCKIKKMRIFENEK